MTSVCNYPAFRMNNMSLKNETSGQTINCSVINCTVNIDIPNVVIETMTDIRPVAVSYVLVCLLLVSIPLSLVILISIRREGTGSFFQWKLFDRFTVYTVLCDLLFNMSILILAVHWGLKGLAPTGVMCTLVGMSITLFSISQTLLTTITAVFVYTLVVHNRQLDIGKYDWILHSTVFGVPLILLIATAVLDGSRHNLQYCDLRADSGFSSWHFGLAPVIIIISFIVITTLYCILFGLTWWRRRQAVNTLQNSAVNTTRLAIKLSLYVIVHFIQFVTSAVEAMFYDPPIEIYRIAAICTVVGGILNAIVYFTVRKR